MKFIFPALFILLSVSFTCNCFTQVPENKKPGKVNNEKLKEKQKKAYKKQEEAFRKAHLARQSKDVRKRIKNNLKETDNYYNEKRKPLFRRIFPEKPNKNSENDDGKADNLYDNKRNSSLKKKDATNKPHSATAPNNNRRRIFSKKYNTQANNNPKKARDISNPKPFFQRIFGKKYKH